jgi:predicted ferric reductase
VELFYSSNNLEEKLRVDELKEKDEQNTKENLINKKKSKIRERENEKLQESQVHPLFLNQN